MMTGMASTHAVGARSRDLIVRLLSAGYSFSALCRAFFHFINHNNL